MKLTYTISVKLRRNRFFEGLACVTDAGGKIPLGPWSVLGRSDSEASLAHGNELRDPRRPWGDTPTGTYRILELVQHSPSEHNLHSYGPSKSLLLAGESGDALLRDPEMKLDGIEMHGGDPKWLGNVRSLRPTFGCLRNYNEDQEKLILFIQGNGGIQNFSVMVEETN